MASESTSFKNNRKVDATTLAERSGERPPDTTDVYDNDAETKNITAPLDDTSTFGRGGAGALNFSGGHDTGVKSTSTPLVDDFKYNDAPINIPSNHSNGTKANVPEIGEIEFITHTDGGSSGGKTPKLFWKSEDGRTGMIKYPKKRQGLKEILNEQLALRISKIALGDHIEIADSHVRFVFDEKTKKQIPVIFSTFTDMKPTSDSLAGNDSKRNEGVTAPMGDMLHNTTQHSLGLLLHLTALLQDSDFLGKDAQNKGTTTDGRLLIFDTAYQSTTAAERRAQSIIKQPNQLGWVMLDPFTLTVSPAIDSKRRAKFNIAGLDPARHFSMRNLSMLNDASIKDKVTGLFALLDSQHRVIEQLKQYQRDLMKSKHTNAANHIGTMLQEIKTRYDVIREQHQSLLYLHLRIKEKNELAPSKDLQQDPIQIICALHALRMLFSDSRKTFSSSGIALAYPSIAETPGNERFPLSEEGVRFDEHSHVLFTASKAYPSDTCVLLNKQGIKTELCDNNRTLVIKQQDLSKINEQLVYAIRHPEMRALDVKQPHYHKDFQSTSFMDLYAKLQAANRNILTHHSEEKSGIPELLKHKACIIKQMQLNLYKNPIINGGHFDLATITGFHQDANLKHSLRILFQNAHNLDLNETVISIIARGIQAPTTGNIKTTKDLISRISGFNTELPKDRQKSIVDTIRNQAAGIVTTPPDSLLEIRESLIQTLKKHSDQGTDEEKKNINNLIAAIKDKPITPLQLTFWATMGEPLCNGIINRGDIAEMTGTTPIIDTLYLNDIKEQLKKNHDTPSISLPVKSSRLKKHCKKIVDALWLMEHRHDSLDSLFKAQQGDGSFYRGVTIDVVAEEKSLEDTQPDLVTAVTPQSSPEPTTAQTPGDLRKSIENNLAIEPQRIKKYYTSQCRSSFFNKSNRVFGKGYDNLTDIKATLGKRAEANPNGASQKTQEAMKGDTAAIRKYYVSQCSSSFFNKADKVFGKDSANNLTSIKAALEQRAAKNSNGASEKTLELFFKSPGQ